MIHLLVKLFVKDPDNIRDPSVRAEYGRLSGVMGIILNLCLFASKFAAGILTSSIAITADAFNNLSDAGSSVVTLIGFRLARQKPDKAHPFGHGRMEYLTGLVVSLLIMLVGLELARSSVAKIIAPEPLLFSWVSVGILIASICVKLWMFVFNRTLSKEIDSAAMGATAADSLSDVVATTAVLASTLVYRFSGLDLDAWIGVVVALFVLRAGWGATKDTLDPLLGQPPEPALVAAIYAAVREHPRILGLHDLVIHDYGPGRRMMSFHAEVPVDSDIMAAHDLIDEVEREMQEKFGIETSIHMDPINMTDETTNTYREKVTQLVGQVDPHMTIHDFRMTSGPHHTNLIFDIVVPNDCALTDAQVEETVKRAVSDLDGGLFFAVIQIDHPFV